MTHKTRLLTLGVAALCWNLTSVAFAGKKTTVGRRAPVSQRLAMDRIDHGIWGRLLSTYVNVQGQVNYRNWINSSRDRQALDNYLNILSRATTEAPSSREGKLAFWINAYNAVTVKGILREYPTDSIRNHTAKLYGYNIWKDLLLVVGDNAYSLEQIEHEILRKMREPKIHFAIVCASHSCPRLLNEAYTGQSLKKQLVTNTKVFFANPENFRYDADSGTFYVSSILKWFASDFGDSEAAQLRTIAPYLPSREAQRAAANGLGRFSYLKYDWSLNEQKTSRSARL